MKFVKSMSSGDQRDPPMAEPSKEPQTKHSAANIPVQSEMAHILRHSWPLGRPSRTESAAAMGGQFGIRLGLSSRTVCCLTSSGQAGIFGRSISIWSCSAAATSPDIQRNACRKLSTFEKTAGNCLRPSPFASSARCQVGRSSSASSNLSM